MNNFVQRDVEGLMKQFLVALLLVGCGGSSFEANSRVENDAGNVSSSDALSAGGAVGLDEDAGAGGAHQTGTGGAVVVGAGGSRESGGASTGGVLSAAGGVQGSGGVTSAGGAPEKDGGCALVTHENGLGQTWTDCALLGTHNATQALKACEAYTAASCPKGHCILPTGTCTDGNNSSEYTGDCGEGRIIWTFAAGYQSSGIGHVANTVCPTAQDPSWN